MRFTAEPYITLVINITALHCVNIKNMLMMNSLKIALMSLTLVLSQAHMIIDGIIVPCEEQDFELYCEHPGMAYPGNAIQTFIEENKAQVKRMYGSAHPLGYEERAYSGAPYSDSFRKIRQTEKNSTNRVELCETQKEVITPYWAMNFAGKLRIIVNTMHFEQAVHQEVCSGTYPDLCHTRCCGTCSCEQKYSWQRLLAFNPGENNCNGIFMDWFMFKSGCICGCYIATGSAMDQCQFNLHKAVRDRLMLN